MGGGGRESDEPGVAASTVVQFWLLALLGPVLAAIVVRSFTDSLSPVASTVVIAAAMPGPLVAAMVVGRLRLHDIRRSVLRGFETPRLFLLAPSVILLVWIAGAFVLTALVGNVADIDGAGRIAMDVEDVRANLADFLDAETAATADLPPVPALMALAVVGGLVAGVSVNGLLAFGEEYGWRGYLWEQLEQRGRLGTILTVGVLWGLWHAPLIAIAGFNYPEHRFQGVLAMIVFAVAASWPLDELRRASGSAVAPAVLHGAINGSAGVILLVVGGDRLWAAPAGLLGALAFLPAGLVARWMCSRIAAPRTSRPGSASASAVQ